MKRQESVYTLELIILIHDAVSVIIRVLVIFKTITIIILISIQDAITVIILILFIGQTVSIIVLIVISNTVVIIIIYSVSETILVRVNITPEGGDGASEEAEAQQEEDLVHVSVVWTQSCPLIPH